MIGRARSSAGLQAAALLLSVAVSSCAQRRSTVQDFGIPPCPFGAERDILSAEALQCWFREHHGRWRTLGHQSHLEALVVEVEAQDLRDALVIATRVVAGGPARAFGEILVYVREEGFASRVRRVRWTQGGGFETLDFQS